MYADIIFIKIIAFYIDVCTAKLWYSKYRIFPTFAYTMKTLDNSFFTNKYLQLQEIILLQEIYKF